ncbi:SipW-dependent-type signal peptide-containing protein [Haloplanus salinus]|jgi:predicted ribosomally synthesized peptide with SipW-like signal peptide|uniref:SipW-dependent-type signal peptide-containing protein n=1 Tax=Haloplanus salinus TaxID=1126245 RepID=UPI001C6A6F66|nr:SipW-dependent-type signal peptide-containing protein [Haloplanus salinus]
MTDERFDVSRRKALAALGTIGVASAGAGLGTSAYFSDQETFENNRLAAGTLDMKVAATEYYSDWSSDEAELAGMASDVDSTDIRLPPGEGQSDAQAIALDFDDDYRGDVYGAFFGTTASDADGTPYNEVNGGVAAAEDGGLCGTESDADGPMIIDIGDVKPGDFGGAQFAFELCDNPGYVWLTGGLRDANENGRTEPEADDPDEEDGVVELLDEIQVASSVGAINADPSGFEDTGSGFQPVEQYTLREFLTRLSDGPGEEFSAGTMNAELGGGTGEQGCFAGETVHQVSVVWWLPINHGNQVQSDSVSFDLGFYTEQCRHNDGEGTAVRTLTDANDYGFEAESGGGTRGDGYWTDADGVDNSNDDPYEQLYLGGFPDVATLDPLPTPFTLGDIGSVSYRTRTDADETQDYFLEIYTVTDGTNDDAWYGRLLQALPGDALNRNAPAGEWVTWSTDPGRNQLTWKDYNRSGISFGTRTGVTLADLQSTTAFDWSGFVSGAGPTAINYRDEEILTFRVATASGWYDSHEGDLDAVQIDLTSGDSVLFDLE